VTIEEIVSRLGLSDEKQVAAPDQRFILDCMQSDDLAIQGAAYQYLDLQRRPVEPPLPHDVFRDSYLRFLERCLREDPQDGWSLLRYEAAMEFRRWFGRIWLSGNKEEALILKAWLSRVFLTGDSAVRDAIRHHVFHRLFPKDKLLRIFFADWDRGPTLRLALDYT
jgi:hypothetical protein